MLLFYNAVGRSVERAGENARNPVAVYWSEMGWLMRGRIADRKPHTFKPRESRLTRAVSKVWVWVAVAVQALGAGCEW